MDPALVIPILAGVVVLKSASMAKYMNENVAGVDVPEPLIKAMDRAKDKTEKSIEIASNLIKGLMPLTNGIHVMPLGWDKNVPAILDRAGL